MKRSLIMLILILVILPFDSTNAVISIGQTIPEFEIQDVLGDTHSLSEYRGKVIILTVAITDSAVDKLKVWSKAEYDQGDTAELSDVETISVLEFRVRISASFMRRMIRNHRKEEDYPTTWVSWRGSEPDIKALFDLDDNEWLNPYLFVVNKRGVIKHIVSGDYTDSKYEELKTAVTNALAE